MNSYDSEGNTVLMLTAQQGHTECVKSLLRAGAHVNDRTYFSKIPRNYKKPVTRITLRRLLKSGPNVIPDGEEYVRLPEEVARVMFATGEKIDQVCNEKLQVLQWEPVFYDHPLVPVILVVNGRWS